MGKCLSQCPSPSFQHPESVLLVGGKFLTARDFSASLRSHPDAASPTNKVAVTGIASCIPTPCPGSPGLLSAFTHLNSHFSRPLASPDFGLLGLVTASSLWFCVSFSKPFCSASSTSNCLSVYSLDGSSPPKALRQVPPPPTRPPFLE